VEVFAAQKWVGRGTWIPDCDGRKRGHLGHYKKRIFHPLEKHGFFALFEKRLNTLVAINKDRHSIYFTFFIFVPKRGENRVKKNIVSNLR
jgi:hypothetical protein